MNSKLVKRSILPGESAELVLEIVAAKQVGEVRKACTINTNDPRAPIVAIPVEGEIKADWRIEQTRLNFGDCTAGTSPSLEFKVTREPDAQIELVRLECLDPNLIIESREIGPEEDGGPGWLIKATLAKTAPAGVYAAAIIVVTDHPTVPANHVMVYARIQGMIQVRPMSRMRFGRISSEQTSERRLTLTTSKDQAFKILSVEPSTEDLLAQAIALEGGSWALQVSVKKDARVRSANESVLVHTDAPGQEAIRVPVSWTTFSPRSRTKTSPEAPAATEVPSGATGDGKSDS